MLEKILREMLPLWHKLVGKPIARMRLSFSISVRKLPNPTAPGSVFNTVRLTIKQPMEQVQRWVVEVGLCHFYVSVSCSWLHSVKSGWYWIMELPRFPIQCCPHPIPAWVRTLLQTNFSLASISCHQIMSRVKHPFGGTLLSRSLSPGTTG